MAPSVIGEFAGTSRMSGPLTRFGEQNGTEASGQTQSGVRAGTTLLTVTSNVKIGVE